MQKITFRKLAGEKYIYPELQGHFIEFLGSCIYDGIWVGEDSEIPNYHGIRKDLVDAFQKLHPPVIRWPGGCFADVYHWRNGIGPREQRPVTYNENFGTFETDPNQFGTHEMMEFCEMIGAKPWFNINMMTGSPSEMREWMEYCNRKEPTALSQERKTNGHEEPFGIEYWGIGNEVWDGGGKMTPQMYANEYRKFSSSCPSFGGGDQTFSMKCIASGPDGNKPKERAAWTKDFFKEMEWRYKDKVSVSLGFIPELSRKIYSGADMFLMPSQSEPCGLAQMIAMRYGTIPIVRETGGLRDTVRDCGGENGNGFTFKTYNAHDMFDACMRAKAAYEDKRGWNRIIKRDMAEDFSWANSAELYIKLYHELTDK